MLKSSGSRLNNHLPQQIGDYYRPQTKLWEGNVFTPVCQSFCSRGSLYDIISCLAAWSYVPSGVGVSVSGPMFLLRGLSLWSHVPRGDLCPEGSPLDRDPPPPNWTETPMDKGPLDRNPLDRDPPRQRPPGQRPQTISCMTIILDSGPQLWWPFQSMGSLWNIVGSGGSRRARGTCTSPGSKFLQFHAVFGKICQLYLGTPLEI